MLGLISISLSFDGRCPLQNGTVLLEGFNNGHQLIGCNHDRRKAEELGGQNSSLPDT